MATPSLDSFLVIARTGSLTKAASELFMTQQNLSSYLKKLETYYGLDLFYRHPRFELTEFGKLLYQEALEIQNIYQRIETISKTYSACCELRLGCRASHPTDYMELLPLQKFKSSHANVKFLFSEHGSGNAILKVKDGSVDFAFSSSNAADDPSLLKAVMRKDYCYVLIHRSLLEQHFPEHLEEKIFRWKQGIALKELKGVPFFSLSKEKNYRKRDSEDDYLQKYGLMESKLGECYSRNGALNMCRHGMCYFVSGDPEPESSDFFSFPVIEPDTSITLYCYCNAHSLTNPFLKDFWTMVQAASIGE